MDISIGKTGATVAVDYDAFTDAVKNYVVVYGLTQILNDAHSSVTAASEPDATKRAEAVMALVEKKLAAMVAGDVRMRQGGSRKDRVTARAIEIALGHVKPIKGADGKRDAKAMRAAAIKAVDANPAFKMLAARQLEEEAALGLDADEIDFGESPEADEEEAA